MSFQIFLDEQLEVHRIRTDSIYGISATSCPIQAESISFVTKTIFLRNRNPITKAKLVFYLKDMSSDKPSAPCQPNRLSIQAFLPVNLHCSLRTTHFIQKYPCGAVRALSTNLCQYRRNPAPNFVSISFPTSLLTSSGHPPPLCQRYGLLRE